MLGYLTADIICFVNFEEQIISARTNMRAYFQSQLETIVFIDIIIISFTTRAVLKNRGVFLEIFQF